MERPGFLVLAARTTPSSLFYSPHFRAVFDSRSSFFVPKPHENACYAGYISTFICYIVKNAEQHPMYGVTIQMKPLQRYFHMVLFISDVVLTLESVDEILWCYHSNETSSAVLSHGTIYLACSCNF